MKRLLGLVAGVLAVLLLLPAQASASALTDCLAKQEVCVRDNSGGDFGGGDFGGGDFGGGDFGGGDFGGGDFGG